MNPLPTLVVNVPLEICVNPVSELVYVTLISPEYFSPLVTVHPVAVRVYVSPLLTLFTLAPPVQSLALMLTVPISNPKPFLITIYTSPAPGPIISLTS